MKNFMILLTLTMFSICSYSQTYKVGVFFFPGLGLVKVRDKMESKVIFSDSTVVMSVNNEQAKYQIVKKINGLVYCTDGIMTHFYTIHNDEGKMKGFSYNRTILFSPDIRQGTAKILLYAIEE